jgi:hypothetical protein
MVYNNPSFIIFGKVFPGQEFAQDFQSKLPISNIQVKWEQVTKITALCPLLAAPAL